MATYLYGLFLARNAALVPSRSIGIGGVPVRVLRCAELAALVSTLDAVPERPTLDDVHAHDAAVQASVDADITVAAARFKQSFASDDDACRHLTPLAARIAQSLSDFDGCIEMRLLLSREMAPVNDDAEHKPPGKNAGPGHAYLETLRAKGEVLPRITLAHIFGDAVRGECVTSLPNDAVAVAHLVHRDSVAAYRATAAGDHHLAGARIVGPMALYSFSEFAA